MEANYFTILYWFCHTSTWICHGCTCVPNNFYNTKQLSFWNAFFFLTYNDDLPIFKSSLEKETIPHSSILAWRIPWTEEPGGVRGVAQSRTWLSEWAHVFKSPTHLNPGAFSRWERDCRTSGSIRPSACFPFTTAHDLWWRYYSASGADLRVEISAFSQKCCLSQY